MGNRTCAHCLDPIQGHAASRAQGDSLEYFHHEDGHMDCYHLATVYGHPSPCECADKKWLVKRRHPESVMWRTKNLVDAQTEADRYNTNYQTDNYYVEPYDHEKAFRYSDQEIVQQFMDWLGKD